MFQMCRNLCLSYLNILLVTLFMSGCSDLPSGRVVDADTGEPVEGAFVLARYEWDGFPISPDPGSVPKNRCYGSLVAQTDALGRYDFATQAADMPTTEMHFHKQVRLFTYAPGYTTGNPNKYTYLNAPKGFFVSPARTVARENDLLKISKTAEPLQEHRASYLFNIISYNICNSATPNHIALFDTMISDLASDAKSALELAPIQELCRMKQKSASRMGSAVDFEKCRGIEDAYQIAVKVEAEEKLIHDQAIVARTDWQENPTMTLISRRKLRSALQEIQYDFVIPTLRERDLNASTIAAMLLQVNRAGLPINWAKICFAADPEALASGECYARFNHLDCRVVISQGDRAGEETHLEKELCGLNLK